MESFVPFLLIGGFVAVAAILAYFNYQQRQQRLADMMALADQLSWRFDPSHDTSHDALYAQFEVFRRGHLRYAYNTLHGSMTMDGEPCDVRMGDYHYRVTSGSGKSRRTRTYETSYLIVQLPYLRYPNLFIRREGLFDALAGVFGFDDIDFESTEFSKQFHVKSDDKRFAYDVVHPAMMVFLMGEEPPVADVESGKCCLTDGTRKWSPQEFLARLHWAEQFFKLWPKHLVVILKSV